MKHALVALCFVLFMSCDSLFDSNIERRIKSGMTRCEALLSLCQEKTDKDVCYAYSASCACDKVPPPAEKKIVYQPIPSR